MPTQKEILDLDGKNLITAFEEFKKDIESQNKNSSLNRYEEGSDILSAFSKLMVNESNSNADKYHALDEDPTNAEPQIEIIKKMIEKSTITMDNFFKFADSFSANTNKNSDSDQYILQESQLANLTDILKRFLGKSDITLDEFFKFADTFSTNKYNEEDGYKLSEPQNPTLDEIFQDFITRANMTFDEFFLLMDNLNNAFTDTKTYDASEDNLEDVSELSTDSANSILWRNTETPSKVYDGSGKPGAKYEPGSAEEYAAITRGEIIKTKSVDDTPENLEQKYDSSGLQKIFAEYDGASVLEEQSSVTTISKLGDNLHTPDASYDGAGAITEDRARERVLESFHNARFDKFDAFFETFDALMKQGGSKNIEQRFDAQSLPAKTADSDSILNEENVLVNKFDQENPAAKGLDTDTTMDRRSLEERERAGEGAIAMHRSDGQSQNYISTLRYEGMGRQNLTVNDARRMIREGKFANFNEFFAFADKFSEQQTLPFNLEQLWETEMRKSVSSAEQKKIPAGGSRSPENPQASMFDERHDYLSTFNADMANNGGTPVDPPSPQQIANSRTIVGQIDGDNRIPSLSFDNPWLQAFAAGVAAWRRGRIDGNQLLQNAGSNGTIGRFLPGFNRIQIPYLERRSLEDILSENLLIPDEQGFPRATAPSGIPNNDLAFRQMYLNNRASDVNAPKGRIAGVKIKDIEEPQNPNNPWSRDQVFTFQSDDAEYLQSDRADRGLSHNIDVRDDRLRSSVINATNKDVQAGQNLSDVQFFPFLFETENRLNADNGDLNQTCFLQATLAQLQESYSPTWSQKQFFGRTEAIHTYTNTNRTIDIRFILFADSARSLQNIYERVNWLAQQTYGSYESIGVTRNKLATGPILRMTIGDLIKGLPGYVRSLNYNWDHSGPGGKWEMTKGIRMPQSCEVSLGYQVLHETLPNRNTNFYKGLELGMKTRGRGMIPQTAQEAGAPKGSFREPYVKSLERG